MLSQRGSWCGGGVQKLAKISPIHYLMRTKSSGSGFGVVDVKSNDW